MLSACLGGGTWSNTYDLQITCLPVPTDGWMEGGWTPWGTSYPPAAPETPFRTSQESQGHNQRLRSDRDPEPIGHL